jgi:hypothetical protein
MPYFFVALGLLAALRGFPRDGTAVLGNETASRNLQKG